MSQYTIFYDSNKEIQMVINGAAPQEVIDNQVGSGYSTLVVDVEDTPTHHYYVNDTEDGVVRKSDFPITVDEIQKDIDEQFVFSNVPEGTSIDIDGMISGTMDDSSTLTLTASTAGNWRVRFTKDKYFEKVFLLYVNRSSV